MWCGNIWSRRGAVLGVVVAIVSASACSDDESGDGGSDAGGSAGSAGASGSSGAAGSANGGSAGNAVGGNAGSPAAGTGGTGTAGRGTGGADAGNAGMGGDDGEAGMGGADAGEGGTGGMGAGRGGMAGAGTGGAGSGGTSGSAGMAGAGGAGSGGMAGGGMAGGGMVGGGMAGGGMAGGGTSGAGGGGGTGGEEPAPINLFFSEYYEGTATPQASAVEIYNAGTAPVDLTQCSLRVYVNGSGSFTPILLITTLAPGDVYVVCSTPIGASCNLLSTFILNMVTGNDAVALYCSTGNGPEVQDIIGQTGFNPPSGQWGTGLASTADNTMRRMCSVTTGDKFGIDAFDPVFQWLGAVANSSGDLGIRFCP